MLTSFCIRAERLCPLWVPFLASIAWRIFRPSSEIDRESVLLLLLLDWVVEEGGGEVVAVAVRGRRGVDVASFFFLRLFWVCRCVRCVGEKVDRM